MTTYETLLVAHHGPVAVITLNRPERLNALNSVLLDEMDAVLDEMEARDDVRALVVHGAGRAFSAGFDLKEGATLKREGVGDWRRVLQRDLDFIMRFWHSPLPTIAAVHGPCLAGACELAMACDITICDETARMGEPELRFGAGIVALLLPWLTNPKRAKEMLLTGNDKVSAREALELGLVNRVVPQGMHLDAALETARTIAVMDRDAVRLTKHAVNRAFEIMGLREALQVGMDIDVQIETMVTPERQEFGRILKEQGLKAALAWREARFG
jgi:enoyl-CoA hydratase/carnithine racemase